MLNRSTKPMRRTEFKQKSELKRTCGFKQEGAQPVRTRIKRSRPKRRPMAERRYALACRGEPCYLLIPGAPSHDLASVVDCHSNQLKHGKGGAIKAADEKTVPGCAWCHHAIDQGNWLTKEQRRDYWDDAYRRWVPVRAVKLAGKGASGVAT